MKKETVTNKPTVETLDHPTHRELSAPISDELAKAIQDLIQRMRESEPTVQ